jgi:membrane protein YqaA with SNARE-associated domain
MKIRHYLMVLVALCISAFAVVRLFPEYRELVILFFYMTASNSFIGIPHEPILIYYGKLYPFYVPVAVSIIPVILGCTLDYIVLTPVLHSRYLRRFRRQKIFKKAIHYFRKFPYATLMVFAISPIPFWPVRILSIVARYPLVKYASATVLGRIPRYILLCLGGMILNIPDWVLIVIFIIMLTIPFLPKVIQLMKRLVQSKPERISEEKDNPVPISNLE